MEGNFAFPSWILIRTPETQPINPIPKFLLRIKHSETYHRKIVFAIIFGIVELLVPSSMAETLSPNPAIGQKQRLPVAARIQSPTSPFFSNDDKLERAQARAARAAAIRRKAAAAAAKLQSQSSDADSDSCLDKQQILDLLQNCIKLASENVISRNFFFTITSTLLLLLRICILVQLCVI